MRALALMVVAGATVAWGQEPVPADSRVDDVEGVSVLVMRGDVVPFTGRLLSLEENLRRGQKTADLRATAEAAESGLLISRPVLIAVILGVAATSAAAAVAVTTLATKKGPGP